MKRLAIVILDYFVNALRSAAIGALVAVALALAQGQESVLLGVAGTYALVGVACGTSSKAIIEGAFSLFGARKSLAYILNAAIIMLIILLFVLIAKEGFGGMSIPVIVLVFALPEVASALIVRSGLREVARLSEAFDKRRDELDEEDGAEGSRGM
jgi:hypothetical protein